MLTLGIVSSEAEASAQLAAVAQQTGLVESIREWVVPGARTPEVSEMIPDIILLDTTRNMERLFSFGAQARRVRPATKLVAISPVSPPTQAILLEAMRSGVQEFLPKPIDLEALKTMLTRFAEEFVGETRPSSNKIIVVMGAKGGVGATTVAVNLAVQTSVFAKKKATLLDFARPLGNAHLLLDLHPKFNVRDATDNLDRLDSHFFSGLLTAHKTELRVLTGTTQPEQWQAISVDALERVVNVARSVSDMVFVDIGSQFGSEWAPLLKMARLVLIVAEVNVPSLWTLQRRLAALKGFGGDAERVKVILNRWHKDDDNVLSSIQKEMNQQVFARIPNDYRKASTSINLGTPLLENAANNGLSARYRQIAAQIAGVSPGPTPKKGGLGALFSISNKR